MKQFFTSIVFLLASTLAFSQSKYYAFSTFIDSFSRLQAPTSLNAGGLWDDTTFTIPIGFNFKYFLDSTTSLTLDGPGALLFTDPSGFSSAMPRVLSPMFSDFADKNYIAGGASLSPLSYKLSGTAPNRIFKFEIRNAGFYYALEDNKKDSIDMQVWLYERDNAVEFRYGNMWMPTSADTLHDVSSGPFMALVDSLDINTGQCKRTYYLYDDEGAPTVDSSAAVFTSLFTGNLLPGLDQAPVNNRVYRFMPVMPLVIPAAISNQSLLGKVQIQNETQAFSVKNFEHSALEIMVVDISGKVAMRGSAPQGITSFSTATLNAGIYTVQAKNKNASMVHKLIVQ